MPNTRPSAYATAEALEVAIETLGEGAVNAPELMEDSDYYDEQSREELKSSDFPKHELPRWEIAERETAASSWFSQMEYRLRWIFYREEREGVSRQRFVHPFNPDDFRIRTEKARKPHSMDTETSKFYDWNIGGTDFIMRLELFAVKNQTCLRCHFIHKPSEKQLSYHDRVWDGQFFREVNHVWANS